MASAPMPSLAAPAASSARGPLILIALASCWLLSAFIPPLSWAWHWLDYAVAHASFALLAERSAAREAADTEPPPAGAGAIRQRPSG